MACDVQSSGSNLVPAECLAQHRIVTKIVTSTSSIVMVTMFINHPASRGLSKSGITPGGGRAAPITGAVVLFITSAVLGRKAASRPGSSYFVCRMKVDAPSN